MAEQVRLAWFSMSLKEADGFSVGQSVTMLVCSAGDDCEGTYHELQPGAKATIDSIVRFQPPQNVAFTVVIETGVRDRNGEMLYIVNTFDDTNGGAAASFKA